MKQLHKLALTVKSFTSIDKLQLQQLILSSLICADCAKKFAADRQLSQPGDRRSEKEGARGIIVIAGREKKRLGRGTGAGAQLSLVAALQRDATQCKQTTCYANL